MHSIPYNSGRRAIQVGGGSEFKATFEGVCQAQRRPLYVLPQRSSKRNGHEERANGNHRYEFYEALEDCPWTITELNACLRSWEALEHRPAPPSAAI